MHEAQYMLSKYCGNDNGDGDDDNDENSDGDDDARPRQKTLELLAS